MEFINKLLEFFQSGTVSTVLVAVLLVVELFLGKTELVKAGSTLELILNGIKKVLEFLKIKKPE